MQYFSAYKINNKYLAMTHLSFTSVYYINFSQNASIVFRKNIKILFLF